MVKLVASKKQRAKLFSLPAFLVAAFVLVNAAAANADKAEDDALRWLAAVDAGRYENSWTEASPLIQQQMTLEKWVSVMSSARSPLGHVDARVLVSRSNHTSLPGVPDGNYVVMIFATDFASKKGVQETVTLSLVGAAWQVAGYFFR